MVNLSQLKDALSSWVADEQSKELLQPGDLSLIESLLGLSGLSFSEALATKQSSFNMIDAAKREVMQESSSDRGLEYAVAATMQHQMQLVRDLELSVSDCVQNVMDISSTCQQSPSYKANKVALASMRDDLHHIRSAVDTSEEHLETAAESLQVLVQKGLVSQESLDDFLRGVPITAGNRADARQVVNELRDRYYTIDRHPGEPIIGTGGAIPNFRLVEPSDSGDPSEVDSISGLGPGQLTPDGKILLPGSAEGTAQNTGVEFQLDADRITKRPKWSSPTLGRELVDRKDDVLEEMSYEIWACLLLNLVGHLSVTWDKIQISIDALAKTVNIQKKLLSSGPLMEGSIDLSLRASEAIESATKAMGMLSQISAPVNLGDVDIDIPIDFGGIDIDLPTFDGLSDTLGISANLATPKVSGGRANRRICDYNHAHYCDIHSNMISFSKNISAEIDSLSFSFGGIDIPSLNEQINLNLPVPSIPPIDLGLEFSKVEKLSAQIGGLSLDVKLGLESLKGEVCALIQRKVRGEPKGLRGIRNKMQEIVALAQVPLPNISDLGLEASAKFVDIAQRLSRAGFTSLSALLISGDIAGFLSADTHDTTPAGRVYRELKDAAAENASAIGEARLYELADVARSLHEQTVVAQSIREGMRRRMVLGPRVGAAQEIAKEAEAIVEQSWGSLARG